MPFKTCTYECIYCQLGQTTCKTVELKEWVPLEQVLEQLQGKLATRPDYITLSGSGEPTLFTPLDRVIDGIRAVTDIPIAVLSNGSLPGNSAVQRELRGADLVIPSLDAGNENTLRLVNRPHEALSFEQMLAGLVSFRRRFRGQYWLEVLLVEAGGEERSPSSGREEILELLRRRPCTTADIDAGLGLHPAEVVKLVESLCLEGLLETCPAAGKPYYRAVEDSA